MIWEAAIKYPDNLARAITFNDDTWPEVHRWLRASTTGRVAYRRATASWPIALGFPCVKTDAIQFDDAADLALFLLFWAEIVAQITPVQGHAPPAARISPRSAAAESRHRPPGDSPSG